MQKHKVRQANEQGNVDPDYPGPGGAAENAETGQKDNDAGDQVNPAPSGDIKPEDMTWNRKSVG